MADTTTSYRLLITAQAPLHFSEHKPGGIFQASQPYIPGAAIRGALALQWLNRESHGSHSHAHPVDGCPFCTTFVRKTGAIFTNGYPVYDADETPLLLPATALACKNQGGLAQGPADDPPHPLFDSLLERLCWQRLDKPGLLYSPVCPQCHERTEAYRSLYVVHNGMAQRRTVQQRMLTRVAINRRRNVAEEGMLYAPFVIDEAGPRGPTQFVAHVHGLSAEWVPQLAALNGLGGGAGRGLGRVQVTVQPLQDAEPSLAERQEAFQARLAEVWSAFAQLAGRAAPAQPDGTYVAITLQADAILRHADGRPTMVYDAALLHAQCGLVGDLVASYAAHDASGGWNGAWGLPKPTELMTQRGATFLFRFTDLPTDWLSRLERLEATGIGHRRMEGYGRIRIAHEFHTVPRSAHVNN